MNFSMNLKRLFSASHAGLLSLKQPKIKVFGLEGRYAHALFNSANKANSAEKVEKDLSAILGTIKAKPKFKNFLNNPVVKESQQRDSLLAVANKIEAQTQTKNFIALLCANGRINKLDSITTAYSRLVSSARGQVNATFTTATEITKDRVAKAEQQIHEIFIRSGETLKLSTVVDPSILGGYILQVEDRYIDLSVRKQVKDIEKLLLEA